MNKNKELVLNTLILGIGQFIPSIITIFLLPILTENLSTEEYGIYDIALMTLTLLIPICTMQIQQGAFRFLITSHDAHEQQLLITNTVLCEAALGSVSYPIVFCMLRLYFKSKSFSLSICLLLLGQTIYRVAGQFARGLDKNLTYSMGVVVYSICNIVIILIFLAMMQISAIHVLVSQAISYLTAGIYMALSSRAYKLIKLRKASIQYIFKLIKYSAPIIPSSISLWVVNLSDRMIVAHFLGLGANGLYSVANKIPNIYASAYSVFNLAWTETAVKSYDDGSSKEYFANLFDRLFCVMIGSLSLLIAGNYIVFKLLVDLNYYEAFFQVPILYLGVFVNCLVSFFGGIYIALAKTKNIGISSIIGAILNAAINLCLIRNVGLYAASISTVISYTAILAVRLKELKKYMPVLFNKKKIIISLFVLTGIIIISLFNSFLSCVVAISISITYNLRFNKYLIRNALDTYRERR